MTNARDTQRQKTYDAESRACRRLGLPHFSPEFDSVEECQAFVDKVLGQKLVRKRFGLDDCYTITVNDGRGRRRAAGGYGSVDMPKWSRNRTVLLHEMVHCFIPAGPSVAWHGWEFCEALLWLYRRVLGQEAHDVLKAEFKAGRVRYSKPRKKRVLSEEEKQVLRDRLAKARAAKAAG